MKGAYERLSGQHEALHRAGELSAKTIIFDVEPLVTRWDSSQEALDRGVRQLLGQAGAVPGVHAVCFATNSARCPSAVPVDSGMRVVYLASARKPLRTAPYRDLPRPGVVIGDQVATDGVLARRLGYAFLHYCPPLADVPIGPRFLRYCGWLMLPFLFRRPRSVQSGHGGG